MKTRQYELLVTTVGPTGIAHSVVSYELRERAEEALAVLQIGVNAFGGVGARRYIERLYAVAKGD